MTPDYTVAVDGGNGMVNAYALWPNGKIKSTRLSAISARVTGDTLGLGGQEFKFDYYEFPNGKFVFGDAVALVGDRVNSHQSLYRYGDQAHRDLTAVALAKMGIKSGEIDLTVFCPPGIFKEERKRITNAFANSSVRLRKNNERKWRQWEYKSVIVLPEGITALGCFALDAQGYPVKNVEALSGTTLVLDLGMLTADSFLCIDGRFSAENIHSATSTDGGIKRHVLEPILHDLRADSKEFRHSNWADVDIVLRRWLKRRSTCFRTEREPDPCSACTTNCVISGPRNNIQLGRGFERYIDQYAYWVESAIIDSKYEAADKCSSIILIGGGGALIKRHLKGTYGDLILDTGKIASVKGVHPIDMNAVGGLRMAMAAKHNQKHL